MLIRLKSSSVVLVAIGSTPMPICNRFRERLANNGKIATFMRVPLFDALVRRFPRGLNLKNRDFDHRNLRSKLKISYAASSCLSQLIWTQFALEMCLTAQNHQKIYKNPLFWHSRSSKVIEFGGNREPAYDFLLVINISHRY